MHIKIIGLDHVLQWKDTDEKHLQSLLSTHLGASPRVELIAEEAYKLPTTVAQRLACYQNIPWKEVDMDNLERQRAGIHDALQARGGGPLMDEDDGYMESYSEQADELREQNWVDKIRRYRVQDVIGTSHGSVRSESVKQANRGGLNATLIQSCSRGTAVE